jgi:NAD(P) transhydrogenase subunit alpha
LSTILGFIAVTAATVNVVGGFMITDRMLRMFRAKKAPGAELKKADASAREGGAAR